MQTQKMSLANIQGKLSRSEMKGIMGGTYSTCSTSCGSGTSVSSSCAGGCGSQDGVKTYCNGSDGSQYNVKSCAQQ